MKRVFLKSLIKDGKPTWDFEFSCQFCGLEIKRQEIDNEYFEKGPSRNGVGWHLFHNACAKPSALALRQYNSVMYGLRIRQNEYARSPAYARKYNGVVKA
jgi:hypothetical protein|tara:strand:+ start:863 stop:1162 length:300 start_codon:yes stop_codon:yes gene_type:complete